MIGLLNLFCCQWYLLRIMFTRTQKRKLVQKKLHPPQKKSLWNRGRGTSFLFLLLFGLFVNPLHLFTNGVNMVQCKSSFTFLFFQPLCGTTIFFTIFIKSTTCFSFLCELTWLLSLWSTSILLHPWTHSFLHHFYQINYMFFFLLWAHMTFVPLFYIYFPASLRIPQFSSPFLSNQLHVFLSFVGSHDFCPFVLYMFSSIKS